MKLLPVSMICWVAVLPAVVLAESGTSDPRTQISIGYTGAPTDHGGQDCTTCHNSFARNSDSRGSVTLDVSPYNPSSFQTIKVTVNHPQARRWGCQLTARWVSDQTTM